MKSLRLMIMGFMFLGFSAFLSSASFAEEAQDQAKIKMLNDAATALVKSNPELAQQLTKFAISEVTEKEDKNRQEKEAEGMMENAMTKERMEHIKVLRDSASALKATNPDLALSLMQMADRSEKKMMMNEGKEDQKESGEKQETK